MPTNKSVKEQDQTQVETAPLLWGYRSVKQFLKDITDWKARHESGFSFRKLSKLAGFSSPGYVQSMIDGQRRITAVAAEKIAAALQLTAAEKKFFCILVAFSQSENEDDRLKHYEQMLQLSVAHGVGKLDAAKLSYFTQWYVPAIHVLASLQDFKPDAQWVAQRLMPSIHTTEAQAALDVLVNLNILEVAKDGTHTVAEPLLETHQSVRGLWVREYHRAMIRLSERAIDLIPSDRRTFHAFAVTVPHEQMKTVQEWADEAARSLFFRILALQQNQQVAGEVMQYNMQMFPLSGKTDAEQS